MIACNRDVRSLFIDHSCPEIVRIHGANLVLRIHALGAFQRIGLELMRRILPTDPRSVNVDFVAHASEV
jgi:hypothetical protein